MGGPETGWFRTESGTVLEMDLPLQEGIAHRVRKGEIVRVKGPGGEPWEEELQVSAEPVELPTDLAQAHARIAELEQQLAEAQRGRQEDGEPDAPEDSGADDDLPPELREVLDRPPAEAKARPAKSTRKAAQ